MKKYGKHLKKLSLFRRSAAYPVPRKSEVRFGTYTYWAHNPLNSRGINGKRTEHQNGRGVPLEGHPTPIVAMTYIIKNLEVKGLALKLRGTPGISLVLWWFCCVKFVSNN